MKRTTSIADWIDAVTLGSWTLGLGWLLLSGEYERFLAEDLWWLPLGGVCFLLLFLAGKPAGHSTPGTGRRKLARSAILLLPLAFLLAGPTTGGLSAHALEQRLVSTKPPAADGAPPVPTAARQPLEADGDSGAPHLDLLDIQDRLAELAEETVVTEGKVAIGSFVPDGYALVYRFHIVCCAADAVPVGVLVPRGSNFPFKADTWVRIEGTVRPIEIEGRGWILFTPSAVTPIEPPRNPYLQ